MLSRWTLLIVCAFCLSCARSSYSGSGAGGEDFSAAYVNYVSRILSEQITGSVYTRGSYHYEIRRRTHNGLCLKRYPHLIAVPQSTDDVSRIVRVAREYIMELSVRSGGHSFLCNSIKGTGIHVDMRRMNKVELASPNEAILGPGSIWKRVLQIIPPEYYTMIHGQCLSVGVGGYLTGSGVNVVGTTERHGSGSQNILQFTMVTAEGDIAEVTRDNVTLWRYATGQQEIVYDSYDLHLALGNAGSSFGIVTEFRYRVWPKKETLPAIAICFIESVYDLRKLERAAQDGRYHVTWFLPYIFHRSYSAHTIGYLLGIIYMPPMLKFLERRKTDPIFVSIVDNRGIPETNRIKAFRFLESFGLKLAMNNPVAANFLPNMFSLYDYESVYFSKEEFKRKGFQAVETANLMGITSLHVLDKFVLDHPVFGFRHKYSKVSLSAGCDFCYFIVVSTSKPERPILDLVNTGLFQIELTCSYEPYKNVACPKVLRHIKETFVSRAIQLGDTPTQYVNTPSCDLRGDFGHRYYGHNYERLLRAKAYWDPDNVFHHCQSIGSTDENCCPQK